MRLRRPTASAKAVRCAVLSRLRPGRPTPSATSRASSSSSNASAKQRPWAARRSWPRLGADRNFSPSDTVESPLVPTSVSQRPARPDELAALQKLLAEAPTAVTRLKRGVGNALLLWAVSLLAVLAAWLALGWIAGKAFDIDLGLRSTATLALVGVAAPLCAIVAALSSVRWIRAWPDPRPQLRDDVALSRVHEERYVFSEAKRFQEPEHGGLIYFLRSNENEVFTVFDDESQSLGVDDKNPLESAYRPRSH